ncbi:MAG: MBL fold metallo-hydrolase [Bacteroidales bacterium]|nr:MBL fold metallo-hydrolase [Bacteroidales bacterium]
MTITYIYHSCYLLEFDEFSVLIDFYKDTKREDGRKWIAEYLLQKEEDLYVLCTHSHTDHFNPEILTWKKNKRNIRYLFSDELLTSGKVEANDALFLRKEESFRDHRIQLKAFGSTDAGCSFLIGCDGRLIFHAGDLNNWHWNEEVSKEEALGFENSYLCELELLSEKTDDLFVAMFPVDPRLGRDYMKGAEQFVSRVHTKYFLPMHFGEAYESANRFKDIAAKYGVTYLSLFHPGQSFSL